MGTLPPTPTGARRVLVAGATGLVGQALLTQLLEVPPVAATVHAVRRLRRAAQPGAPAAAPARPGLHWLTVDFRDLPALPEVDDVYIALGTTIRQAGSQAAFRAVDFDAVLAVARAARQAGAERLGVVSALGADASSRGFYNRVKGEMEQAVEALGYPSLVIARPSLLLGDRAALGQPGRPAERFGVRLLGPLAGIIPRKFRPIEAAAVARALKHAVLAGDAGVSRLESGQMLG